jgi:alkyldihydroxyacetonephosphate synthase
MKLPLEARPLGAVLAEHRPPGWVAALRELCGTESVRDDAAALWVYSRDRAPYAVFSVRRSYAPAALPGAVVSPGSIDELQRIIRFARERRIAVLPFGAGSGVLGGALPMAGELVVDLKRLDAVVDFEPRDALVTVQAGMNGARLEAWLNERGWTTGHHPQSLHMSTVGGWAACRGAGQSSTRYGKIEDMVQGCTVVLPDGRVLGVAAVGRRSTGPSIKDIFVGSEGVFGIIAAVTLRIWPKPEVRKPLVLAFPSLHAGFDATRQILHKELRPAVVRLYDEHESAQRAKARPPHDRLPVMAIMEFAGNERMSALEYELSRDIAIESGAVVAPDDPYHEWLKHRYLSISVGYQVKDWFADTIEVTGRWSTLPAMHASLVAAARAAHPALEFGAHWSHCYPEGACEYMTMRLPPMDDREAAEILFTLADRIQEITLAHGGAISHHHGIGLLRGYKLLQDLGLGLEIVQAIKDHLDPHGLFVPGKLGLAQCER